MPFVIAEDEERSPWEPYHVEHGFYKNASTVTAGATMNWGFQGFPSGDDPEGYLKIICGEIVRNFDLFGPVNHGPLQMMTVLMTPSVAEAIAHRGYSKKDVEQYLFENSRLTIRVRNSRDTILISITFGWPAYPHITCNNLPRVLSLGCSDPFFTLGP